MPVPSLTALAAQAPAKILVALRADRAARGDAEGALRAVTARATWLVDQQHRHAQLGGVSLAANDNALAGTVAA